MERYQFVYRETPTGRMKRNTHLDRRTLALAKAAAISIFPANPANPVEETYICDYGYYTWTVDTPSKVALWAFIRECLRHPNVDLFSGPIPVFTAEEESQIEILSAQMRKVHPDK